MHRYNRRNLVKIRRLAEEAMRSSPCTLVDGAWETFSGILCDIDECLERNGQPYTGVTKAGFTASWSTRFNGIPISEEPEEEGYVCCS